MRKHNHRGRPKWKLLWVNQYERKYICTYKWCRATKSFLAEGVANKRFYKAIYKNWRIFRKMILDAIYESTPLFDITKKKGMIVKR